MTPDEITPKPAPAPAPDPHAVVKPATFPQAVWDKLNEGTKRGVWWSHQPEAYKKANPFGGAKGGK